MMHLNGKHAFNAAPLHLWELLNSPQVLTRIVPGVQHLSVIDEDRYDLSMILKLGPVNGPMSGILEVKNKVQPEKYTLAIDAKGKMGSVAAEGVISILSVQQLTHVTFTGDAQVAGKLARMGQRVLNGVAKRFTKQFFKALEKEIRIY